MRRSSSHADQDEEDNDEEKGGRGRENDDAIPPAVPSPAAALLHVAGQQAGQLTSLHIEPLHQVLRLSQRRRIKTEEKAKVVAAVLGTEFIQFLATLAILHREDLKNRMNSSYSEFHPGTIHPFLISSWCKLSTKPAANRSDKILIIMTRLRQQRSMEIFSHIFKYVSCVCVSE